MALMAFFQPIDALAICGVQDSLLERLWWWLRYGRLEARHADDNSCIYPAYRLAAVII
jgi:hypothetical protein